MELKPGNKLGPYELVSAIGKGGMGELWKALDPRLGRDVAIKVSAQQFTDRFEREARAIAALNHTNICTLYDVGPNYLVMELIEGPTLADRIKEGAVPLKEALRIAKQIAAALEAAHDKNIVHRDLKPANVKIKPDGSVKVLDFGLAKSAEPTELTADSPTMMSATHVGMILGTAGYMAPEQARGKKDVDKRADIWAFGVVLYEMLTGKRLFLGEDVGETLAAVIKEQPDLSAAPLEVLPLLKRCLEKEPKNRLRYIGDWELLLPDPSTPTVQDGHAATAASRLPWTAAAALMAVVAAGLAFGVYRATRPAPLKPLVRLDVDLGADVSLPPTGGTAPVALSPDGTRMVYASGNPVKLFIRRFNQPKATELRGTEGALGAFFSPDGQWVGFAVGRNLSKISVEGGAAVPMLDVPGGAGASWGEDGSILIGAQLQGGMIRIPAGGGPPETLAKLADGDLGLFNPQLLPGGKAVLFSTYHSTTVDGVTIEVLTLADRRRKVVLRGGVNPQYLPGDHQPGGHLLYTNKNTLFAIPFDLDKLETHGTAVPVLDDVAYVASPEVSHFSLSSSGSLVYRRAIGGASTLKVLQWVTPADGATGKKEPLRAKPGAYANPALSPDGKRVALSVTEGGSQDIWVYDPQRDAMTRLTFGGGIYRDPVWSPDGQYVVFASFGNGIFHARADGAGQPQALTQSKLIQVPWSFTPDGKRLAYFEVAGNPQIWTVPLEDQGGRLNGGKPEQFLKSSFTDAVPSFSPDGRWLLYGSNESGKPEVYVRAFPPPASGQAGKWQVSNGGGTAARWSRNGRELMFQSGDQIMAARYAARGDAFVAEKPRVWLAQLGGALSGDWDLAPDGKRVAVVMPGGTVEAPQQDHEIVMLQNFADELQRKVPLGK
jgi:hypothetical protein